MRRQSWRKRVGTPAEDLVLAPVPEHRLRPDRHTLARQSKAEPRAGEQIAGRPPQSAADVDVQLDDVGQQQRESAVHGRAGRERACDLPVAEDVGAWLDDRWRPCLRYLRDTLDRRARRDPRASRRLRRLSSRDVARLTTPEVHFTVTDWPESADTVSALVEVIVHLPQQDGSIHNCRTVGNNVSDVGDLTADNDLGLFVERKTFGFRRLATRTELVRIPPTTFDDYPNLERELESIADLTPTAALNWAVDQQVAEIQDRDPRFLGTTIRGEHLGYVAPWAILFLHVYLLVNLYGLRGQIQNVSQGTTVITWIAAMKQPWAILFSSLTLVVLPVVAAVFARWRLTPIGRTDLLVWMLVLFAFGVGTMILAQSLQRQGDANLGVTDDVQG